MIFSPRKPLAALVTTLLFSGSAVADVTIEQRTALQVGGALAMLDSTGTSITHVSGDKSYSASTMKPQSKMMAAFMDDSDTATIIRLDEDMVYQLMPSEQQYSGLSFDQLRAQMEKMSEQIEDMQQDQGGALPVAGGDCQWSPAEVSSRATGEKEKIAGMTARQHLIEVRRSCDVPSENRSCDMTWTLDQWLAKRMPGDDEAIAFQRKLAERLGVGEVMAQAGGMAAGFVAMYQDGFEEALAESGDLEGYPVKSVMQLKVGGPDCTTAGGQQIAMDDMWSGAVDSAFDAALDSASAQAGYVIEREAQDAMSDSIGGSIAGSALGSAGREVVSGLFKSFKKKSKEPKEEPAAAGTGDEVIVFRLTTEITEVDKGPVPADRFEVPAGWTRVSADTL